MSSQILLVDDDKEFREEFTECMDEYDVQIAEDGNRALEILRKPNEIAVIILDVKMPGLTGTEVLAEIRKSDYNVGVIILTAFSNKKTIIEALRGKADDYIEKPLDIVEMKKILNKLILKIDGASFDENYNKIERIKRFIKKNILKKVTLQETAKIIHLSPKYLSRLFRQITGTSFNDYKLLQKITKAKEALKGTTLSINRISENMGYMNPESFIRMFKKITGCTPKEFRKKYVTNKK